MFVEFDHLYFYPGFIQFVSIFHLLKRCRHILRSRDLGFRTEEQSNTLRLAFDNIEKKEHERSREPDMIPNLRAQNYQGRRRGTSRVRKGGTRFRK
jgi:hypothetical protein